MIVSGCFKAAVWGLAAAGLVTLLLIGMIARPLTKPPTLAFISETVRAGDREGIPPLLYFQARDGSRLAYRHYAPRETTQAASRFWSTGHPVPALRCIRWPRPLRRAGSKASCRTFAVTVRPERAGTSAISVSLKMTWQTSSDLSERPCRPLL